jgi:hypothetical protein
MLDLLSLPAVRQKVTELKLKEGLISFAPGAFRKTLEKKQTEPIGITINGISLQEALNSVARAYGHTICAISIQGD